MKTTLHKLFIASAFLLTFSVVAYGLPEANGDSETPVQVTEEKYPEDFVSYYKENCASAVSDRFSKEQGDSLCTCIINKFEAQYPFDEFVEMTLQAQEGQTPDAFIEIGESCAEEVIN